MMWSKAELENLALGGAEVAAERAMKHLSRPENADIFAAENFSYLWGALGVAGLRGTDAAARRKIWQVLKENGVHDDYLLHCDCTQGSTMIQVSPKGENCILLFGQSNHAITKAQVEETIAAFAPGDYLVLQNEVSCLPEMVEAGARRGLHVVLNPSPFDDSLRSLDYNQIRWIFINEVEGHQMTGETAPDAILSALRAKYPALCVVLTLGSAGSICCTPVKTVHQPFFRVQAVDTTAAGDTFTGYFLAALTQGLPLETCMARAAAAAAISVTRQGAAPSIPRAEEVDAMLRRA